MQTIKNGLIFKGTNLIILIFAILLACIGLNIDSLVVLLGAMLVSPVMWPIVAIGVAIAIADARILRRAIGHLSIAIAISVIASTLYFLITPLESSHSELLNRTSPTFFDAAVAFFGGFAAIIAIISRKKWTVLAGVGLATSLLPPLCSIGYGIVQQNLKITLGGAYLFAINLAFIALASMIVALIIKLPRRTKDHEDSLKYSGTIIAIFSILTAIPSVYFGMRTIEETQFKIRAEKFIKEADAIPDQYLLKEVINPRSEKITLVYGGEKIKDDTKTKILETAKKYNFDAKNIEINQGITALKEAINDKQNIGMTTLPISKKDTEKTKEIIAAKEEEVLMKSAQKSNEEQQKIFNELSVLHPKIDGLSISSDTITTKNGNEEKTLIMIETSEPLDNDEKQKMREFLSVRIDEKIENIIFFFERSRNARINP